MTVSISGSPSADKVGQAPSQFAQVRGGSKIWVGGALGTLGHDELANLSATATGGDMTAPALLPTNGPQLGDSFWPDWCY